MMVLCVGTRPEPRGLRECIGSICVAPDHRGRIPASSQAIGFCDLRMSLADSADRRNALSGASLIFPSTARATCKRKFLRACRSLAMPERNTRRRAVRIFDQHPAGLAFYATNPPRGVAQQHDVTGVALDREVFVERADHGAFRFSHYGEQRRLRNRSAAGDCRQACTATCAQFACSRGRDAGTRRNVRVARQCLQRAFPGSNRIARARDCGTDRRA